MFRVRFWVDVFVLFSSAPFPSERKASEQSIDRLGV